MSTSQDKPFKCSVEGCNEGFANSDHLEVHVKRHLKLQCPNRKSSGSADTQQSVLPDETPTPSRFLRAFEEAGLEEDLQQNPFDATFAKASIDKAVATGTNGTTVSANLLTVRDPSQHDVAAVLTCLSQQPSPVPNSPTPTAVASLMPTAILASTGMKNTSMPLSMLTPKVVATDTSSSLQSATIATGITSTSRAATTTTNARVNQQSLISSAANGNNVTVISAKEKLQHSLRVKAIKTNAMATTNHQNVIASTAITTAKILPTASNLIKNTNKSASEISISSTLQTNNESPRIKRTRRSQDDVDPEERRRRFLERNRAAATRCREKKKRWIGDLDRKVKDLTDKNTQLQSEAVKLRSEVAQLKTLLIAYQNGTIAPKKEHLTEVSDAESVASSALTHLAMTRPEDRKNKTATKGKK